MLGFTKTRSARSPIVGAALGCALSACLLTAAQADQITAKGDTLNGKLISMGDGGLVFETAYAKDKLAIKYEDVTDIRTDGPVQLLHGEDGETIGRMLGMENGNLLVGTDAASATPIELSSVTLGTPTDGVRWTDRMRSNFRYWHGSFDFGFGLTRSRIDDTILTLGFSLARKKAPTRFFLDVLGAYGKSESDEVNLVKDAQGRVIRIDEVTTETRSRDNLLGRARGEYDLTKQLYVFGAGSAEYDGIQRISIRGIPKAGLGYRIWETKTDIFQVEAGGAWVYEKFFGGDDNNFWAVAFGSFLDTGLWYGSRFTWRMDYLPAIDDWLGDYIVRNELALLIPLFDPFKLKLAFLDEYNSTPASEVIELFTPNNATPDPNDGTVTNVERTTADYNKLIFTIGLALAF